MKNVYMLGVVIVLATACSDKNEAKNSSETFQNAIKSEEQSSSTEKKSKDFHKNLEKYFVSKASQMKGDSLHLFIKKAQISAISKHLFENSIQLEDSCLILGGYIESSTISKEVTQENTFQFKRDSSITIEKLRLSNHLIVRVPEHALHRYLKAVQNICTKIEYRKVSAENVAINLLKEKRKQEIIQEHTKQFDGKNTKVESEVLLAQKLEELDSEIEQKRLEEEIRFSEVDITLKSPYRLDKIISPSLPKIKTFTTPITEQFSTAFEMGWSAFVSILIGLTHLWIFFLLGIVVWSFWRKFAKRK